MNITATKVVSKYSAEEGAWYFAIFSVREIKKLLGHEPKRTGWGQIRVQVKIGESKWQTSLFPSKELGYCLPIKAAVRKNEGIEDGDKMTISISPL